ncbi:MAG: sodium-independent anion transporter [Flavobacteriales bacterium]|nr:sodium-independent anion transporter [Candidatus Arcticimaribacter sp.]
MKKIFTFDFKHLRGDLFGGLTAGIVALPLALAFGVSSGLGPSAGLYGAIFLSFFAALFGGTATQISGPTAPMTAVSMVFIAEIISNFDGNVEKSLPTILAVFLLAGILQVGIGMIGLGKYIRYIPYPVVSGFMTAIGVIILVTQIPPTFGYYPKEDVKYVQQFKPQAEEIILENILKDEMNEGILVLEDFKTTIERADKITEDEILTEAKTLASKNASGVMGTIKTLPKIFAEINFLEVALAFFTILIIFGFKRITTKVPSTLVALFVVSGIAIGFGIDYRPIAAIPSGLPIPQLSLFGALGLDMFTKFIFTALTLAFLGAIDSLLTSVVSDNMTKTVHKPNKELIGQGIGNSIGAIFGGLPGAGATIRTVVNINAGGKTRLSGMIAGVLLLIILLALGPIASKIPAAVLAGILITVGIGVMDYKGLKAIPSMPRQEVIILIVVLVLSTFWNLVYAVGIGLVIASLIFMKKIGDLTSESLNLIPLKPEDAWEDEKEVPKKIESEIFIKHINGPLFFGSTSKFTETAKQIPKSVSTLIIRLDKVPYIDQSGLYALESVIMELSQNGKKTLLVGAAKQPKYMMERIDIIPDLIPKDQLFDDFENCLEWLKKYDKS